MDSVPTSLGEWIHSPWFDLGLVVWKGYRPRVRLVLAGGHASAWISPFWRGPAPGAQRYQAEYRTNSAVHEDDRPCFDFRGSQECQEAIAGRFPSTTGTEDQAFLMGESIRLLQQQHNDRLHEANIAIHRVHQSWQYLHDAYASLFS